MPDRDVDDLGRARSFVSAVLRAATPAVVPSVVLLQTNYLGPMAYRRGVTERRAEYAASLIMADRRHRTLREVTARFASRGIELVLIKGAAFAGTIYPDPAERPMHDIDVLIRIERLPEASRLLLELGFERVGFTRKLSAYYHAVVFRRGDIMFELHRNIVQRFRTRISVEALWERSTPDPLGSGARRLDPIDDLLICTLHIARHELAVPAINYVDVRRLWDRLTEDQHARLRARAADYRVTRAVEAVLQMTELLARGASAAPSVGVGSRLLLTTDDVLLGVKPRRARQIGQKLLLTEGARERLGLGFSYVAAIAEGWYRGRAERQR